MWNWTFADGSKLQAELQAELLAYDEEFGGFSLR